MKESLRLHPIIPMVVRFLMKPSTVGGHELPAGVSVGPSILLAHADPENFPQPEEFRPTRFLDEQVRPNTWIPFGGGVRRCIGAGFSLMEGVEVLREVLTAYDVGVRAPGTPTAPGSATSPASPTAAPGSSSPPPDPRASGVQARASSPAARSAHSCGRASTAHRRARVTGDAQVRAPPVLGVGGATVEAPSRPLGPDPDPGAAVPETVFGLPVHPLVVHATVVLVPLTALVLLLAVLLPRFRAWAGWLPLGLAVVSTALAPISTSSGENLEHQLGETSADREARRARRDAHLVVPGHAGGRRWR